MSKAKLQRKRYLIPVCDERGHLVCMPYRLDYLHLLAERFGISPDRYHRGHYKAPEWMLEELMFHCKVMSSRDIVRIKRYELKED